MTGLFLKIVDDPDCAFMSDEMRSAVRNLAKHVPTAIISGRSRDKSWYGHHVPVGGRESADPSSCIKTTDQQGKEVNLFQPAREFLPMIDEVFRTLVENTKDIKGAKVENHKFCASVHYRNVDEKNWPTIAQCVHDVLDGYPQLRLTHGRKVLEVRPLINWNKGKAVEFLLDSLGLSKSDDVLPVYIGDDKTDEDAFKVLREGNQGYGILVSSVPKETKAVFSLKDPSEKAKFRFIVCSTRPTLNFYPQRSFPQIRASSGFSSSLDTGSTTELDSVASYSEIVPDTVIFDDFERFPPTAATVSSSLLLGICSLPDTTFRSAVDTALADSHCYGLESLDLRMSCFANKALVNVGGDLAKMVPGRVSTEVDARLAYDTHGIVRKVHNLLALYNEIGIPPERLLFKIPSTWQGIEASSLLEAEGVQTHMTFVYSFCQAAAAAQAGASVIQIFVGRIRDWARNHSGDPEIEAALKRGEDPGVALVSSTSTRHGYIIPLWVDYIITPLKILQSLKESITPPDDKYSFTRRLSPQSAATYNFSNEQLVKWDQYSFASAMGPAAVELLTAGLDGYVNQAKRVEELFGKIWPPPNV
ncbi:hypothetical protein Acr_25g0009140 [Actinidia rufa]|uniref:Trehalose 6-phosphate phosphatase n=1 Tax=Actinidia rufa TaxID=165716 RepID=A0A7J0H091_9ERIC|nr:hypothetical protein Acr_25g0009140 [Actinidia rufa]